MKNGKLQCKDIDDGPVLDFLAGLNGKPAGWHNFFSRDDYMPTVLDAMPSGVPEKLVLAKMRQLMRKGLVSGCGCGCRGDFCLSQPAAETNKITAARAIVFNGPEPVYSKWVDIKPGMNKSDMADALRLELIEMGVVPAFWVNMKDGA